MAYNQVYFYFFIGRFGAVCVQQTIHLQKIIVLFCLNIGNYVQDLPLPLRTKNKFQIKCLKYSLGPKMGSIGFDLVKGKTNVFHLLFSF